MNYYSFFPNINRPVNHVNFLSQLLLLTNTEADQTAHLIRVYFGSKVRTVNWITAFIRIRRH